MKNLKKIIITVIVLAILIGGTYEGIHLYRTHKLNTTELEGVSVETLNNADWLSYRTVSYSTGMVSSNNTQTVNYNTDKIVSQINVKVGDTVNAGDVLLVYDTAKDDLSVERKEIEIQQMANDITLEQRKLDKLKTIVPVPDDWEEPDEEEEEVPDVDPITMINTPRKDGDAYNYIDKKAEAYEGKGTSEKPYKFLCTEECYVYGSYLNWLIEKGKAAVFEVYEGNDLARGDLISSWKADGNKMSSSYSDDSYYNVITRKEVSFSSVEEIEVEETETEEESTEEIYTVTELKEEIEESEDSIKEMDLKKRKLELELEKTKASLGEAQVVSKVTGVVTKAQTLDQENGLSTSEPLVEVSASTGRYLTGTISELQLDTLKIGDTIEAVSWSSNKNYTATITEIQDIPVSESSYWGYGSNPNVSYYPFTAYVEDGDDLEPGDALDLSISGTSDEVASIILEKSYVRKENGNYYVYKADENDRLVKQYVKTGRTYEGYYIEILNGLSEDDFIVFPYGKDVKEGAKVQHDEVFDGDSDDMELYDESDDLSDETVDADDDSSDDIVDEDDDSSDDIVYEDDDSSDDTVDEDDGLSDDSADSVDDSDEFDYDE